MNTRSLITASPLMFSGSVLRKNLLIGALSLSSLASGVVGNGFKVLGQDKVEISPQAPTTETESYTTAQKKEILAKTQEDIWDLKWELKSREKDQAYYDQKPESAITYYQLCLQISKEFQLPYLSKQFQRVKNTCEQFEGALQDQEIQTFNASLRKSLESLSEEIQELKEDIQFFEGVIKSPDEAIKARDIETVKKHNTSLYYKRKGRAEFHERLTLKQEALAKEEARLKTASEEDEPKSEEDKPEIIEDNIRILERSISSLQERYDEMSISIQKELSIKGKPEKIREYQGALFSPANSVLDGQRKTIQQLETEAQKLQKELEEAP